MDSLWELFPYPTLADGEFTDGSILSAHKECVSCPTRECAKDRVSSKGQSQECRFGFTYARVDDRRLVTSVVCSNAAHPSKRASRRYRDEPSRRVTSDSIRAAVSAAQAIGPGLVDDFQRSREEVMKQLQSDPALHRALAEQLRTDFQENLDQSHDFLQLVKQVRGHAEVLLRDRLPNLDPVDAAEQLPTEGAIYFSTELMLMKMNALLFMKEINLAFGHEKRFQIHPCVLKYVRIYSWQANQKRLSIGMNGACYASIRYNDGAIGAVIQALLDNMVKYAPSGSKAGISFDEYPDSVRVTFSGLGPKIESEEASRIFLPGHRGGAARRLEASGLGVGLATAKQISDALGLGLSVHQEGTEDVTHRERYATSFAFDLQRVD